MARHLDRYVAKVAWGAYAAGLSALLLLSILMDALFHVFGYVSSARDSGLHAWQIVLVLVKYYTVLIPLLFVTVSPFVTVIAGMFAVSRLMAANEVVPMLFTGRSIARVLRPVLAVAVISALVTAACWQFVVPEVTGPLRSMRQVLQGDDADVKIEGLVLKFGEDDHRQTLFCGEFDPDLLRMERIRVLDHSGGADRLTIISASAADWDPEQKRWDLENGQRVDRDLETAQQTLELPGLTPELLRRASKEGRDTIELSYSEILNLQALRPGRPDYVMAFHSHITFPIANIVLLLLALPFAVHFERGGKIERVVMAIVVCASYLITDLICQNLGQAHLHPVLAAWLPTILFGSIGVVTFASIRT